jgi:hypothetical protein
MNQNYQMIQMIQNETLVEKHLENGAPLLAIWLFGTLIIHS